MPDKTYWNRPSATRPYGIEWYADGRKQGERWYTTEAARKEAAAELLHPANRTVNTVSSINYNK